MVSLPRGVLPLALSLITSNCFFDADSAQGLRCDDDEDCGDLRCIADVCGGGDDDDDDDDDASSTGTTTMADATATSNGSTTDACTPASYECDQSTCCSGSVCVDFTFADDSQASLCAAECGAGTECASCCCQTTDRGVGICVPGDFCESSPVSCTGGNCALGGSLCQAANECCDGVCALAASEIQVCFKSCAANTECDTGCCSNQYAPDGNPVCQSYDVCYPYYGENRDDGAPSDWQSIDSQSNPDATLKRPAAVIASPERY